jgi:protein-S-isoprenylcysteine O-methyltransferase Ste14
MVIASVFSHLRILAEEKSCLAQYGDSYQSYMQRVPRYLLLF